MNIHVQVLKGERPVLFAWLNADSGAVDGCLVTCSCQEYGLGGKPQNETFAINMGRALERAQVLTLRYGSSATGVMNEDFDEESENEERVVERVQKKRGRRKKKIHQPEENERLQNGELEERKAAENVPPDVNDQNEGKIVKVEGNPGSKPEHGGEKMHEEGMGGEILISSDDRACESSKVNGTFEGESLDSSDGGNRTSLPMEEEDEETRHSASSLEGKSQTVAGSAGSLSTTPRMGKPIPSSTDEVSGQVEDSESERHSSGGEGGGDEWLEGGGGSNMNPAEAVSAKQNDVLDIRKDKDVLDNPINPQVGAPAIPHGGNSYVPVEVDGVKIYVRDSSSGVKDFSRDGSKMERMFEGSQFDVTAEGNAGSTVKAGDSETREELNPRSMGDKLPVASQAAVVGAIPPTTESDSLNIPSAAARMTIMTSGGSTFTHGNPIPPPMSSATSGQSLPKFIMLRESGEEESNWTPEQEQNFLENIESVLGNPGTCPPPEVTPTVVHRRRDHDYSARVMRGEAAGPLNCADQAKMDRYLAYRQHKDSEFRRKYRQYQAKQGIQFVLCELCAAPLTNKNLKHHMVAVHAVDDGRTRRFPCEVCGKSFLVLNNLKRHMDKHTGTRYKCTHCDKTYSQDHSRKLHEFEHTGQSRKTLRNPFAGDSRETIPAPPAPPGRTSPGRYVSCEVCPKKLRPASLKQHMATHQSSYFTCKICSKLLRMSGRRDHMARHSAKKRFECRTCSKRFISMGALTAHTRVHTNERPYKCTFCEDTFKSSHTRNTHERIHTGVKPYRCNKCDKDWRDRTTYWGHMKKHHPGEPLMYIRKSQQIQAVRDAAQARLETDQAPRKQLDQLTMLAPQAGQVVSTEQPDNIVPLDLV